jgi:ABC-type amino acid transport substrate-binding protein/mono/diheme cytochrome c family protein
MTKERKHFFFEKKMHTNPHQTDKSFLVLFFKKEHFLSFALLSTAAQAAPLRVCADPSNPPFSSNAAVDPGFYLELGAAIGERLDRAVQPVWELTYYGKHALRETLLAGKCDMSVGLPADVDFMGRALIFSRPFLHIGYALVTSAARPYTNLASLRGKTVAVQLGTAPQNLLATHDDITMSTFVNPEDGVRALAGGRVDAAFVWGPSAGYLNHTALHDAYRVTPIDGPGMQWNVAVGFARTQTALRDQVDQALAGLGGTVTQLAHKYGFPDQAPVALAAAANAPHFELAGYAPAALPIVRVATQDATDEDQQSAADYVAPNRGAADTAFHAAATPTAAAEGRTIFNGTCNHCHGPDAQQSVKKIDLRLLHHRYGGAMDQVFHYTVTHGRESKGMPNWTGVFTEDDFAKMLAFLHTVQTN